MPAARSRTPQHGKPVCRLCLCKLNHDEKDDFERELCRSCTKRPEARRLDNVIPHSATAQNSAKRWNSARSFTAAEKSLIRKVHGYMPAQQLLNLLNERLASDLGPDALPYTMEQLHAEIADASGGAPMGGHDWASLRKLLAHAQRSGILDAINEQVVADFAVVYSLNDKQLLVLKDIILEAKEG